MLEGNFLGEVTGWSYFLGSVEGPGGGGRQPRRPKQAGRQDLAVQPVQAKVKQMFRVKVQPGLSLFDLGVQYLAQLPKLIGLFEVGLSASVKPNRGFFCGYFWLRA